MMQADLDIQFQKRILFSFEFSYMISVHLLYKILLCQPRVTVTYFFYIIAK